MSRAGDASQTVRPASTPERQFRVFIVVLTALLALVAYANTLAGDWVWDDVSSVLLHQHVQDPAQFFQLFREDQHAFGKGAGNFYRPLVAASFMLDFQLAYHPLFDAPTVARHPEVKPLIFHITNLLWHLAAALLLFALLTRLRAPRFVRAVAPLVFVVHPLHTEAVAYISGRADMMSATFMFAALFFALSPAIGKRRVAAYIGSVLLFIAALLSKESSLIYPVLLLVLVLFRAEPHLGGVRGPMARLRRRAVPLGAAAVVLVAYVALRATVLRFGEQEVAVAGGIGARLLQTAQAFAFYIQKLFLPTGLHMEQTLADTPAWTAIPGVLFLALCVGIIVFGLRKGYYRMAAGMAWFLAAWLPISGIFPLNAPMAEHWMYVPMAGFWWALAELLYLWAYTKAGAVFVGRSIADRETEFRGLSGFTRPASVALVFLLVLVFTVLTVQRNLDWANNVRLFRATLAHNPDSFRVQYNLAVTYEALTGNLAGARRHFEDILERYQEQKRRASPTSSTDYLLEDEIDVRLSLARIAFQLGRYGEAIEHYGPLSAVLDPNTYPDIVGEATAGIARSLLAQGEFAGANYYFEQAIQVNPAYEVEATALLAEGKPPAPIP